MLLRRWLIRCVARWSATTSPSWSTATSTSPTSATPAAGSARSRSAGRRRRLHAVLRGGRPACVGGLRRRRHRGVHAGRDRSRVAGHGLRRSRAGRQEAGAVHARARVQPDGGFNGAAKSGESIRDWLIGLREAGLDTIPGTAAEILDDEVRWVLTKGKLPTSAWIEVVTTAHEVGLRSSSTMMYGHVDAPKHWVGHLRILRDIQDRTGGFTEFVPLPFVHQSSPLYLAGGARPGPTHRDNRAVHALGRIMLHGRISHIQTSWVKLGVERTRVMLNGGANDLGGTLMEETISRMAGSEYGSAKTVAELVEIAAGIGRPARQRTTTYAPLAGYVPSREPEAATLRSPFARAIRVSGRHASVRNCDIGHRVVSWFRSTTHACAPSACR